ncbi:hypothetical protein ACJ73_01816 [Blastomyces percursus]|uniref:Amino acid permease/ SLC12A domain-containing protein n=1 Tax=Blastomyces percursus TaxID=1658174 RepID=A0A1J9RGM8_9EURO|nr:hypothetical protein ACJ73_01816 [Blastomyces percursus]
MGLPESPPILIENIEHPIAKSSDVEKFPSGELRKRPYTDFLKSTLSSANDASSTDEAASLKRSTDQTHRKLKPRHIQLIGIGGTIGTALYVQIGKGLMNGGPASLFLAFTLW